MSCHEPDPLIEIPLEVGSHEHGLRLDLFLSRRMKRMSRSLAARLIRLGRVRRVPPDPLKAARRVFEGERYVLKRRPLGEALPDDIAVPILYEDHSLLAVNKPGNLVVHPTASHYHRTLIRIMRTRLKDEDIDLAHRIDKETSGLVLLGKGFQASSHLKRQFARRRVSKTYLALVLGRPEHDHFHVRVPLRLAESTSRVVMEVTSPDHPEAQPAATEVFVRGRGRGVTLVEVRPETGRQHQIRVHLSHVGLPILGDKLYLGGEAFFLEAVRPDFPQDVLVGEVGHHRQALHACSARFCHPDSGEALTLRAPLAEDLQALARRHGVVFETEEPDRQASTMEKAT